MNGRGTTGRRIAQEYPELKASDTAAKFLILNLEENNTFKNIYMRHGNHMNMSNRNGSCDCNAGCYENHGCKCYNACYQDVFDYQ